MSQLHIGLLCRVRSNYSNQRFITEIQNRGHKVHIINFNQIDLNISQNNSDILYQGESLKFLDAIIPRIPSPFTYYAAAVLRHFEMLGIYCLNGSLGIGRAKDKLRSLQILARKNIPIPSSIISNSSHNAEALTKSLNGAPVIVKLVEGMQGMGTVLAETDKAAVSIIEAFSYLNTNMILQEFIKEADGKDLRVFVVGKKIVAAMEREAKPGDFRSNLHRGGTSRSIELTAEEERISIEAVKELRLRVAGVDIIRSSKGPLILEVNSSPGLEGIERTSQLNVADKIIEFIENDLVRYRRLKIRGHI